MMLHFPYLGIPCYNRYSRYGYHYPNYTYPDYSYYSNNYSNCKSNNGDFKENSRSKNHKSNVNNSKNADKEDSAKRHCNDENQSPMFNLLGIDLYFDDILIICLIWFLYSEDVKDEELFIALILLLLS